MYLHLTGLPELQFLIHILKAGNPVTFYFNILGPIICTLAWINYEIRKKLNLSINYEDYLIYVGHMKYDIEIWLTSNTLSGHKIVLGKAYSLWYSQDSSHKFSSVYSLDVQVEVENLQDI